MECVGEEGKSEVIKAEEGEVTMTGKWCASEADNNLNAIVVIPCPAISRK